MLDPRIYRTGFIAVALAVIVLRVLARRSARGAQHDACARRLQRPGGLLAHERVRRDLPGSPPGLGRRQRAGRGHRAAAAQVQGGSPSRRTCSRADRRRHPHARERDRDQAGEAPRHDRRRRRTVTRWPPEPRVGLTGAGLRRRRPVGHRDLLELARVLAGETQHRTIVLASTSGSAGAAGAAELARTLPGPIDAVIVLGDLAASSVHQPIIVPWSDGQPVAPPMLRNTVAAALASQAAPRSDRDLGAGPVRAPRVPVDADRAGPVRRARDPGGAAVAVRRARRRPPTSRRAPTR